MPNPILDQIEEINIEYEQDDEIDTKILQDLIETIEVELYERQTLISSLSVSFDNDIDGDED